MPWLRSIAIALALTALLAPASQAGRHKRELRTLVNGERAGHGVAKLRPAPALARSARRHARALLARGVLAHARTAPSTVAGRPCEVLRVGAR
jgi:uncharacterized protein YkwD